MPSAPASRARPRSLLALSLAVGLAACAVPSGELPSAPPVAPLPGATGVVLAAGISPTELIAHDVGSGRSTALRLPDDAEEVVSARWLEDGTALASVLGQQGAAVFRLSPDADPEAVGAPTGAPGVLDVRADTVLASSCRQLGAGSEVSPGRFEPSGPDRQTGTVRVLSLDGDRAWKRIGEGCLAALSPDASQVAHSPDGRTLWITAVDGSRSRRVFHVSQVALQPVSGKRYTIKGPLVWSEHGIALAIDSDGSDAVVKLSSEGGLGATIPLAPRARDFFLDLAWSPRGDSLAVAAHNRLAFVNVVGFVALIEGNDEQTDVISVQPQFSDAVLWSPDGEALLVAGTGEPWVITDLAGNWLERVPAPDLLPLDWQLP